MLPHRYLRWTFGASLTVLTALAPNIRAQVPPTVLPYVFVLATDPTALEGTSSGSFTLIRQGPDTNDLTVYLDYSGTASNGVDYATLPSKVMLPTGSLAVDIPVLPILDTTRRGNKTVILTLETNATYRLGRERKASVLIVDDVYNIQPPTISLTSPTNGAAFDDPATISLTADVSDPGISITSVSFYANDRFLGKVLSSPYSLVWSNPPAGHFSLFARAVNQIDQSTLSPPIEITITDTVPVVTITSPTNGQNFTMHDDITVGAEASDTDDAIRSVSFYANTHLIGTATNAPYSVVWSNAPAGTFLLRARAVDQSGDRGYSKPVLINVSKQFGPMGVKSHHL